MTNIENYQEFTASELTETIDEAKRALRIIKQNDDMQIKSETKFMIGEAVLFTLYADTPQDYLILELTETIQQLEEELKKRKRK